MGVDFSIPTIADIFAFAKNVSLGADSANIDIQNIPQNYTDLLLIAKLRSTIVASVDTVNFQMNGDTVVANHRCLRNSIGNSLVTSLTGDGSSQGSAIMTCCGSTSLASHFGILKAYIKDYALSTVFKHMIYESASTNGNSAATLNTTNGILIYEVNDAINRLTLFPNTGPNFLAGCSYSLYLLGKT